MKEIIMISAAEIYPHPENPRMQLGDLTELSESIKKNGIMQNLTVVPGHFMSKDEWVKEARAEGADAVSAAASYRQADAWVSDGYTVVIGHRRLAAAKAAGLEELPCVISDMNHREQIATMLEENMQRADLTVYEQAQGFQMRMDLGFTAAEISEKTGFSRTTVDRRLKMAELDKETFEKAVGKQITMDDLDKLAKIKSLKQRNALLKKFGDSGYNWEVSRALQTQKAHEMRPAAMEKIRAAKLDKMKADERYSGKYRQLYQATVRLYDWDGKSDIIPKTEQKLLYMADETTIEFFIKEVKQKAEPVKKTEAEIEKEKRIALAWKTVDRITRTAEGLRSDFVQELTVKPSNAMQMLRWTIIAAMSDMMNHNYETKTGLKKAFGIEGSYFWEQVDAIEKVFMEMNQSEWPMYIMVLFEGLPEDADKGESFASGYRKEMPKHQRNTRLEQCYKWLTEFGYKMSEEEIQMMAGTHPVFQEEMKV